MPLTPIPRSATAPATDSAMGPARRMVFACLALLLCAACSPGEVSVSSKDASSPDAFLEDSGTIASDAEPAQHEDAGTLDVSPDANLGHESDANSDSRTDSSTQPPDHFSSPIIGANLNGVPRLLSGDNLALLDHSQTTWVRAFLDIRKKMANGLHPQNDPDIISLREAADKGVRLIVSFKWDFKANWGDKEPMRMPAANSPEETELFRAATRHLRNIERPVDLVVLGNEPMWETLPEDIEGPNPHLIGFTRRLKDHLIAHGDHGPSKYIVGAFNQMGNNLAPRFEPFVNGMLELVRNDADIVGVDVHTHFNSIAKARNMLEAARDGIGDGLLLDTEFSPIWRYKDNVGKDIGTWATGRAFADQYGVPHTQSVVQYLQASKQNLISAQEYAAFMEAMPWYNTAHLEDMYALFEQYDVAFGGLGFVHSPGMRNEDWTRAGWQPFHINFLYQPAIVAPENGVESTANSHYLDDYRRYANP